MIMTKMLQVVNTVIEEHGEESSHAHSGDFWTEFIGLATDPAHIAFEFVFSLIFDFIIVTLLYGIVIQKVIIPRLRKSIHEEIDKEHGIVHPKDSPLE